MTGVTIDEDAGTSSLELLLEEMHEYDFEPVECTRFVDPVRILARES